MPAWAYPLWNTGTALALVGLALIAGITPTALGITVSRRSLVVAAISVAAVATVYAAGLAIPSIRAVFRDSPAGSITAGGLLWATLVRVPFGTVLLEELAFRGVLPALLGADGQRWMWRPVLGASALFGLWHLYPALQLAQCDQAVHSLFCPLGPVLGPVAAIVAATGFGILLSALRHVGGSLLAPFLAHVAANSGGYLLTWLSPP